MVVILVEIETVQQVISLAIAIGERVKSIPPLDELLRQRELVRQVQHRIMRQLGAARG